MGKDIQGVAEVNLISGDFRAFEGFRQEISSKTHP